MKTAERRIIIMGVQMAYSVALPGTIIPKSESHCPLGPRTHLVQLARQSLFVKVRGSVQKFLSKEFQSHDERGQVTNDTETPGAVG